jgi:hypothetical protein
MVDFCLLAALEKQQISSKVYESAYNKSGSKVVMPFICMRRVCERRFLTHILRSKDGYSVSYKLSFSDKKMGGDSECTEILFS